MTDPDFRLFRRALRHMIAAEPPLLRVLAELNDPPVPLESKRSIRALDHYWRSFLEKRLGAVELRLLEAAALLANGEESYGQCPPAIRLSHHKEIRRLRAKLTDRLFRLVRLFSDLTPSLPFSGRRWRGTHMRRVLEALRSREQDFLNFVTTTPDYLDVLWAILQWLRLIQLPHVSALLRFKSVAIVEVTPHRRWETGTETRRR